MSPVPVQGDLQGRVVPVLLQDTARTAKRGLPRSAMWPQSLREERGLGVRHLLLKLIGQEQELASSEPPDIELAEILELTVDLVLADPRPPPDGEDEHRRADTRVIWARKVLKKKKQEKFFIVLTETSCN